MDKKTLRIITVLSTIMIVFCMMMPVFATDTDPDKTLTPSQLTPTYNGTGEIKTVGQNIMGILNTVGIVVAVIVLMVLGIKYMMGSAEEKAEYKKTMIPYIVGAILIFAATTLANMVYKFANGMTPSSEDESGKVVLMIYNYVKTIRV